jgi:trans-aconitate methyltransferase
MPDAEALSLMYNSGYEAKYGGGFTLFEDASKDPRRVVAYLKTMPPGLFVDYGCGGGELLVAAREIGWRVLGVEFDAEFAAAVSRRTGVTVVSRNEAESTGQNADVMSFGDVIEHLPNARQEVSRALGLLKPRGVLVAQGPLEAQSCLFTFVLKTSRRLRSRPSTMPPFHVMFATAKGQRTFFRGLGLEEQTFDISEVAWPAPSRLRLGELRSPRKTGLFALRKVSQVVSALTPGWGNRFFYVGRRTG